MQRIMFYLAGLLLVVSVVALACKPETAAPPAAPQAKSGPVQSPGVAKESWQVEWEKVLEAGKKEGKVVAYGGMPDDSRSALVRAFHDRYGIQLEYTDVGGTQTGTKIVAERDAGLFLVDLQFGGFSVALSMVEPKGGYDPMDDALILPEVREGKQWLIGKLDFVDPAHKVLRHTKNVLYMVTRNTNLVKPGDVTSYYDLLDPKWKGKITINNPGAGKNGLLWWGFIVPALRPDYISQLLKQEPVMLDDPDLQLDWLAHGRYAIGIGLSNTTVTRLVNEKAPIMWVPMKEGEHAGQNNGSLALMNKAPHPNAAKVFINWFLGKEGQSIYSKTSTLASQRLDLQKEMAEYIHPDLIPKAGVKYFEDTVDTARARNQWRKEGQEAFAPLMKK